MTTIARPKMGVTILGATGPDPILETATIVRYGSVNATLGNVVMTATGEVAHTNNGTFTAYGNYGGNSVRGIYVNSLDGVVSAVDQNTERLYTSTGGADFVFESISDMSNPSQIGVDESSGDRWVTDLSTNLIYKQTGGTGAWAATGGYLGGVGSNIPHGVAVNSATGDVWAISKTTDLVYKLTGGAGSWVATGTYTGSGPNSIAVNRSTGDVWVIDSVDFEVYRLTGGLGSFAAFGSYPGASGVITVDTSNNDVWVMNQETSNWKLFLLEASAGTFAAVGSYPDGNPVAVAVDSSNGDIFVTDSFGPTAIVYRSPGVAG